MEDCSMDETKLLTWYSQFTIGTDNGDIERLPATGANVFYKVPEGDIAKIEVRNNCTFPRSYFEFLVNIGWGRMTKGADNIETIDYSNVFLHPNDIEPILRKKSVEWLVYPDDFIDEGEIPFFDLGDNSVYVFSGEPNDDKVYFPGQHEVMANSFHEFLEMLMNDSSFWADKT